MRTYRYIFNSQVPSFTLNANYGTFAVSIKQIVIGRCRHIQLETSEVDALESFQVFLRDSIYDAKNPILKLDPNMQTYIAPLTKGMMVYKIHTYILYES